MFRTNRHRFLREKFGNLANLFPLFYFKQIDCFATKVFNTKLFFSYLKINLFLINQELIFPHFYTTTAARWIFPTWSSFNVIFASSNKIVIHGKMHSTDYSLLILNFKIREFLWEKKNLFYQITSRFWNCLKNPPK